jgi:hypothetical protein
VRWPAGSQDGDELPEQFHQLRVIEPHRCHAVARSITQEVDVSSCEVAVVIPDEAGNDRLQRRRALAAPLTVIALLVAATLVARRLGYQVGGNVVVRSRMGHLFTTIWIPGANLKALDLGLARLQRCPVGKHGSIVIPVREANLTCEQRRFAQDHHDVRIP